MSFAKSLLIGAALAASTPAFACDCITSGWGGRYGVHRDVSSQTYDQTYQSSSRERSYERDGGGQADHDQRSDGERYHDAGYHDRGDQRGYHSHGYQGGEFWGGERGDERGGYDHQGGGYHTFGGGYGRTEQTAGSWSYHRIEERPTCGHLGDRGDYGRRLPLCGGEGEVNLPGDFFLGDAGVGGFEDSYDGGGGGGGGFAFAGGGASAHASASASARASVSVRFRGGFHGGHGGGHHGGGGHKGGGGCGCGK